MSKNQSNLKKGNGTKKQIYFYQKDIDLLDKIQAETGEGPSEIVRRLLNNAGDQGMMNSPIKLLARATELLKNG